MVITIRLFSFCMCRPLLYFTLSLLVVTTKNIQENAKFHFFFLFKSCKKTVLCASAAKEISFERSHHRISSTDSKVRTTLHVFIIDSRSERVKLVYPF